ncbi:MAG: hypothetical protein WCA82_00715, partial [Jiangellales bacterium]
MISVEGLFVKLRCEDGPFELLLSSAAGFWSRVAGTDGRRVLIVDAMNQDFRVQLRQLTVANVLRSLEPSDLVVVTGPDQLWVDSIWPDDFVVEHSDRMAEAYGARDVLNLNAIVETTLADDLGSPFSVAGRDCPPLYSVESLLDTDAVDRVADATACRMLKVPRLDPHDSEQADYLRLVRAKTDVMARLYSWLFSATDPVAFVTSHVDYHQWGTGVQAAVAGRVPVVHVQATGGVKAFAWYPTDNEKSVRRSTTVKTAQVFDNRVWPQRDNLRPQYELATRRNRDNMGRPAWWRGAGPKLIEIGSPGERRRLRELVAPRHDLDPDTPIVGVFAHAVSDALGTNHAVEDNLSRWLEMVAEFAVDHPEANWMFFDHPNQSLYDVTNDFASLAARFADVGHMRFMSSADLTKNAQLSLVDLGLTVRGSVGNEYPAFGIPVVQAGWSEFSHCKIGPRADSPPDYWHMLSDVLKKLSAGESVITDEQICRARLWLWFYRSMSDVETSLVPNWHLGDASTAIRAAGVSLRHAEPDADPLFAAMERMWLRRDPMLLRVDTSGSSWAPLRPTPVVATDARKPTTTMALKDRERAVHLETDFDDAWCHEMPVLIGHGTSTVVRVADGFDRGGKGIGRCLEPQVILGVGVRDVVGPAAATVHLRVDHKARKIWRKQAPEPTLRATRGRRGNMRRLISFGTGARIAVAAMPPERVVADGPGVVAVTVPLEAADFVDDFVLLRLTGLACSA